MKLKDFAEINYKIYSSVDKKILRWVFKNEKILTLEFKKKYPRSPFEYVVQIPVDTHFILLSDEGTVRKVSKVSYLTWTRLKRLGCPKI